jgi:hypothetical protein
MMQIMEIMDCIEADERFLGRKKEDIVGPDEPNSVLPTVN